MYAVTLRRVIGSRQWQVPDKSAEFSSRSTGVRKCTQRATPALSARGRSQSRPPPGTRSARTAAAPRLLEVVRERIRYRHFSYRTEQAYVGWIRRYIGFHGRRHPREMGAPEIESSSITSPTNETLPRRRSAGIAQPATTHTLRHAFACSNRATHAVDKFSTRCEKRDARHPNRMQHNLHPSTANRHASSSVIPSPSARRRSNSGRSNAASSRD